MRRAYQLAVTPEARLAAAFDWLRNSAAYLGKSGARTESGHGPRRAGAVCAMERATEFLAGLAADVDDGRFDHAGRESA